MSDRIEMLTDNLLLEIEKRQETLNLTSAQIQKLDRVVYHALVSFEREGEL